MILPNTAKRLKVVYNSLWETQLRATELYLPYWFTQYHLPPDTGERAPL